MLWASYKGRAIGTFGASAAFSAQTYKHLNGGEGGFLILTTILKWLRAPSCILAVTCFIPSILARPAHPCWPP